MNPNMVASDDANPNFVGARNPDDGLHAQFYVKTLQNEFETKKQERPIFYEADFIKIHVPGDKNFNLDVPVNDTHKQRFPRQWAIFCNNKKADTEQLIGTPIKEWSLLRPAQAEELRHLGFRTIESIADASDAGLQKIGMVAGMQPHEFRERAKRFLNQADHVALVTAEAEKTKAAEERAASAEQAIAELRAQMAALQPGKPGRKPRQTEPA